MTIGTKGWTTPTGKKARWEIWVSQNDQEPMLAGWYYQKNFAVNAIDAFNRLRGVRAFIKPVNTNEKHRD